MKLTHKDFLKPCPECGGKGIDLDPCSTCGTTFEDCGRELTCMPDCDECQGSRYTPQVELIKIEVPKHWKFSHIEGSYAYFKHCGISLNAGKCMCCEELLACKFNSRKLPYPQGKIETYVCEVCKGKECKETCKLKKERGCGRQCFPANMPCPFCRGDHTIKTKLDIKVITQNNKPFFEVRRVRV